LRMPAISATVRNSSPAAVTRRPYRCELFDKQDKAQVGG
jgi:hypothetical protein